MRNLKYWLAMTAFGISSLAVVSCGDDDDPNTTTRRFCYVPLAARSRSR